MPYAEGFVVAVPAANKEIYRKHAADAWTLFQEFGAARMVEAWDDDVPEGKLTDLRRAVQAKEDEVVVFSWFEYPDKATRDAANEKMRSDPRMEGMAEQMPFDGMRMIYGGFAGLLDNGEGGAVGYVDGMVAAVPSGNRDAYREFAAMHGDLLKNHGANRVVDTWGDDVPDGKITDFRRAVQAAEGETVVFAWIEWPSKEVRDEAWKKVMEEAGTKMEMPFDGKRMIFGGFVPIVDVGTPARERVTEMA